MGQTGTCERERESVRDNCTYLGQTLQRNLESDRGGSIPPSTAAQSTAVVSLGRRHFRVCRRAPSRTGCGRLARIPRLLHNCLDTVNWSQVTTRYIDASMWSIGGRVGAHL